MAVWLIELVRFFKKCILKINSLNVSRNYFWKNIVIKWFYSALHVWLSILFSMDRHTFLFGYATFDILGMVLSCDVPPNSALTRRVMTVFCNLPLPFLRNFKVAWSETFTPKILEKILGNLCIYMYILKRLGNQKKESYINIKGIKCRDCTNFIDI